MGDPATPPARATNTSIATATPLPPGGRVDFELPCDGSSIYFGPFQFAAEGEKLVVTSTYQTSSTQMCGGGGLVDGSDVQVTVAGLGCAEDSATATMEFAYEFAPSAGNSNANPVYLRYAIADNFRESCVPSRGSLQRQ